MASSSTVRPRPYSASTRDHDDPFGSQATTTVFWMRVPVSRTLGVALSLAALAACTSSPADTIEVPSSSGAEVTGGKIILSGDLNDDVPAETTASTVEPPAPASSSSVAPETRTASVETTPRPATTARPTTTDAEVVGDGPVLTFPDADDTSETPGIGGELAPAFFALEATTSVACAVANPGTVELRWEVIGSEAVDIAIGSATKIFRLAQPPAGTLDVPLDCADGSTYFVVARNADGSTTRSVNMAADAAG
jgi:hypothetical protein